MSAFDYLARGGTGFRVPAVGPSYRTPQHQALSLSYVAVAISGCIVGVALTLIVQALF